MLASVNSLAQLSLRASRFDGDMEAGAHAHSLVAMMDIEMVEVSVRFELAIPANQAILLGHDRPSTGTKLRPIAEMDVSRCPGFDLLVRVVAEIDDVDGVVEQPGNLFRIPKLEPAQKHSAVLKSLVRDRHWVAAVPLDLHTALPHTAIISEYWRRALPGKQSADELQDCLAHRLRQAWPSFDDTGQVMIYCMSARNFPDCLAIRLGQGRKLGLGFQSIGQGAVKALGEVAGSDSR
jgi:hypothetical protein